MDLTAITFYHKHLIWKVLLRSLENPMGASGQAHICDARSREQTWEMAGQGCLCSVPQFHPQFLLSLNTDGQSEARQVWRNEISWRDTTKKVEFVCSIGKLIGRKKPDIPKVLASAKNLTGGKVSQFLKTGIKLQTRLEAQGKAISLWGYPVALSKFGDQSGIYFPISIWKASKPKAPHWCQE